MAIEIVHFFKDDCSKHVNIEEFERDFRREFARVPNVSLYMIHQPFLNNVVDVFIDLILVIAVERKKRNYYRLEEHNHENQSVYLHNVILPICFIDEYRDYKIQISNRMIEQGRAANVMCVDNREELDYDSLVRALNADVGKFFNRFLQTRLGVKRCLPVMWVLSPEREEYFFPKSHIVQAYRFGLEELLAFFRFGANTDFDFVPAWMVANDGGASYAKMQADMNLIGTYLQHNIGESKLTKRKMDWMAREMAKDADRYMQYQEQHDEIEQEDDFVLGAEAHKKGVVLPERIKADMQLDQHLVLIKGKAGSGKTTELMLLMHKQLERGNSVRYITYNKFLKNSMHKNGSYLFKGARNRFSSRTIHKFIYDLGTTMGGAIFVMGASRVRELWKALDQHIEVIKREVLANNKYILDAGEFIGDQLRRWALDLQMQYRDAAAELFNFIRFFVSLKMNQKHYIGIDKQMLMHCLETDYKTVQRRKIQNMMDKQVFIQDYYGVLQNIYTQLYRPDEYHQEYKKELEWEEVAARILKGRGYDLSKAEEFKTMVKRSRNAYARLIPFIDEGQDFHPLERDILFELYRKKRMVVATGGREQLIRHQNECDWEVDDSGSRHPVIVINKRNKSYRMKKEIADLCNFLAQKFEINLDLQVDKARDAGSVHIDFKSGNWRDVFLRFAEQGKEQDLHPCDSVYVMMDSGDMRIGRRRIESVQISEHNVAQDIVQNEYDEVDVRKLLGIGDHDVAFYFYHNKNDDMVGNNEYLSSFYESCRGMEAWSVMCLGLDVFYERKKNDEQALKFLAGDVGELLLTEKDRRRRYAMTWVLMALTRPMDGLYIHIRDQASELGKVLFEYQMQRIAVE